MLHILYRQVRFRRNSSPLLGVKQVPLKRLDAANVEVELGAFRRHRDGSGGRRSGAFVREHIVLDLMSRSFVTLLIRLEAVLPRTEADMELRTTNSKEVEERRLHPHRTRSEVDLRQRLIHNNETIDET